MFMAFRVYQEQGIGDRGSGKGTKSGVCSDVPPLLEGRSIWKKVGGKSWGREAWLMPRWTPSLCAGWARFPRQVVAGRSFLRPGSLLAGLDRAQACRADAGTQAKRRDVDRKYRVVRARNLAADRTESADDPTATQ